MNERVSDVKALQRIASEVRRDILRLSHRAKTPHIASCLSCADVLTALLWNYLDLDPANPSAPGRDRFFMSKGHAAAALYTALSRRGFYDSSTLFERYCADGSEVAEHPGRGSIPGVESASGSLGHGLALGAGAALADRMQGRRGKIAVLLSDGECNEGSVWEAAMFAPAQKLGSLRAVVDYNKWQATDRSEDVLSLKPLAEKWKSFGWRVFEVDGNDMNAVVDAFNQSDEDRDSPAAIIAHTVKGKGVSFMEDDNNWHYAIPNDEQLSQALAELGV